MINKQFYSLLEVFSLAYERAACGKGKERHAEENQNFEDQIICSMPREIFDGDIAFNLGQALKKAYEHSRLNPKEAVNELLDTLVYIAGAIILLKEKIENAKKE